MCRDGPASSWGDWRPLYQGCMRRRWREWGKGKGPFLILRLVGVGSSSGQLRNKLKSAIMHQCSSSLPWHTHKALRKIPAFPSSQPLLCPQPSISRQTPADSLFQTRPQSIQRSVPHGPISGQISMIGISTRRAPQRSLRLLLPTSSPKSSSTPRRG